MFDFLEILFVVAWVVNQATHLLGIEDPLDVSELIYNTNLTECKFEGQEIQAETGKIICYPFPGSGSATMSFFPRQIFNFALQVDFEHL